MTVQELARQLKLQVLSGPGDGESWDDRDIQGVFCCDLLSYCMSNAPADYAWVTVMGNVNALAVAALTDTACIVLACSSQLDEQSLAKARQQKIWVLATPGPIFETARGIDRLLGN